MNRTRKLESLLREVEAMPLVDELEAHPELQGVTLNAAQRFYLNQLVNKATIPFGMHSGDIEQDRLNVYNRNGDHYLLSLGKKIKAGQVRHEGYVKPDDLLIKATYLFGKPDFDFWMELLRADERMVEIVNSSASHHPVLGRLDGVEGRDNVLYSRPLLIVPGVEDKSEIHAWERRNTFDNTLTRRAYQHIVHAFREIDHKLVTPRYP
ncbi:MAG: hypothetical protein AABX25_04050 [Nanoarchaeota archaeon]